MESLGTGEGTMDGKKWQDRWIGPVRETLEKLSRPQRLSLALLGASLFVALGMLTFSSNSAEEMVLFPTAAAEQQVAFTSWLTEQRIPHELSTSGVRVPRSELDFITLEARLLRAEGKRTDHYAWVDDAVSFQETRRSRLDRMNISNLRSLEDALARSEGIAGAIVHFTPPKNRNTVLGRNIGGSASVQLTLDPTEFPAPKRLPPKRARVAGQYVAAALGLNISKVTVTDHRLNKYDLSAAATLLGVEENPELRMRAKISDFLEQTFPIGAFTVLVDVRLSRRSSEEMQRTVDPNQTVSLIERETKEEAENKQSARAPGLKPNVAKLGEGDSANGTNSDGYSLKEKEFTVDYGTKEVRTAVPAGEIEEVAISLSLDLETVVNVLRTEEKIIAGDNEETFETQLTKEKLETELQRYAREWEQKLVDASSLQSDRVKASVHIGTSPRDEGQAMFSEPRNPALVWAADYSTSLALLLFAVVGGYFLLRVARSGVPVAEELPDPVAELEAFLARREEKIAAETEAEKASNFPDRAVESYRDLWAPSEEDQGSLELVEEVTRFAQENSEVASVVIRQWLANSRSEGERS